MKKVKIWQVVGVILVGSFAVKQTKKFIMRHFENEEKSNQKGE